ncbi:hypothetical protein C8J56DRAFT_891176 [Mycena floridula]|nr:hypothetical protein C8J56DRAFT_891176 [Mycena floridula]
MPLTRHYRDLQKIVVIFSSNTIELTCAKTFSIHLVLLGVHWIEAWRQEWISRISFRWTLMSIILNTVNNLSGILGHGLFIDKPGILINKSIVVVIHIGHRRCVIHVSTKMVFRCRERFSSRMQGWLFGKIGAFG